MESNLPDRRHLTRLTNLRAHTGRPIYFVTMCALNKRPVLTTSEVSPVIVQTLSDCFDRYGWVIGRYVIMPDHLHFFCSPQETDIPLSSLIRNIKKWTGKNAKEAGISGALWQKEFFDHLLRNPESYRQKLEYVEMNPVRAGLCSGPDEWPFSGVCDLL